MEKGSQSGSVGVVNTWKNILFDTPNNYFNRGLFAVGTPHMPYIKDFTGILLFMGFHRGHGKRVPYGIRYNTRRWTEKQVEQWWDEYKKHCTWFK